MATPNQPKWYELKVESCDQAGNPEDWAIIECTAKGTHEVNQDPICTTSDLVKLFDAGVKRWGNQWSLDDVIAAIEKS